jgi:coenzyme A diphosphatase NUDT7
LKLPALSRLDPRRQIHDDALEGLRMDYLRLLAGKLRQSHSHRDAFPIRAAVVVPLFNGSRGVEVMFELRPRHLNRSPGEVSFPGGRVEKGESLREAALRELEEELGIAASQAQVLGRLQVRQRRRGELVYPFVCLIDPDAQVSPQPAEVEECFSIPLDTLLGRDFGQAEIIERYCLSDDFPARYLPEGRWGGSQRRPVYFLRHERFLIWGLTAAILLELLHLLGKAGGPLPGGNVAGIFGENP